MLLTVHARVSGTTLCGLVLALLPGAVAMAGSPAWHITVEAGAVDRSGLPIRAPVIVAEAEAALPVRIALPDGSSVEGQFMPTTLLVQPQAPAAGMVARDLVFRLPTLPPATTAEVNAEVVNGGLGGAPRLVWKEQDAGVDLLLDGSRLIRYEMPAYDAASEPARVATYKPFHHVFDPASGIQLTKGEGGQFTHHRGIFFGYSRIKHGADMKISSDCWHCVGKARQEHRALLSQTAGNLAASQRVVIDWIGSDASRILGETREVEVMPAAGGTIIDLSCRLEAEADVALSGDPQHAGVHFRAASEVHDATRKETYYLRPGVKAKPGQFRNWPGDKTYVDAAWHAASFVVGGERFTVLRVNRPANPGEARMSERDYGRFGSYFEASLAPGKPLEVGYRWFIQPGELSLDEAARIAADYQAPARVAVSVKAAGQQ